MKKLISPLPAGKMPLYKDDLTILQDNVFGALEGFFNGIDSDAYVIDGMAASLAGPNVVITPGLFWCDGEILTFPGYTGAFPVYVFKGTPVISTKVFFNGSTQNVYEDQISANSLSAPGGQFILFNHDTNERLLKKFNERFVGSYTNDAGYNVNGAPYAGAFADIPSHTLTTPNDGKTRVCIAIFKSQNGGSNGTQNDHIDLRIVNNALTVYDQTSFAIFDSDPLVRTHGTSSMFTMVTLPPNTTIKIQAKHTTGDVNFQYVKFILLEIYSF